jgi:hypothetical protein
MSWRLGIDLPCTNDLAYFDSSLVTKKKFFMNLFPYDYFIVMCYIAESHSAERRSAKYLSSDCPSA